MGAYPLCQGSVGPACRLRPGTVQRAIALANGSFLFTALLDAENARAISANAQGAKSFNKAAGGEEEVEEDGGGNGDGGEEKGEAPMPSIAESVTKIVALDEAELLAGLKQMALAQSTAHARATFRRLVRLGPPSHLKLDLPRPTPGLPSAHPNRTEYLTTTSSPSLTQGSIRVPTSPFDQGTIP